MSEDMKGVGMSFLGFTRLIDSGLGLGFPLTWFRVGGDGCGQ